MTFVKSESIRSTGVVEFYVILDSNPRETFDVSLATSDSKVPGNIFLEYDVSNVSVGNHTIRIGVDNGWETTWGSPDPLAFTRPVPISAFGISLVRG